MNTGPGPPCSLAGTKEASHVTVYPLEFDMVTGRPEESNV